MILLDLDLFYFQTSSASHQRGVWCLWIQAQYLPLAVTSRQLFLHKRALWQRLFLYHVTWRRGPPGWRVGWRRPLTQAADTYYRWVQSLRRCSTKDELVIRWAGLQTQEWCLWSRKREFIGLTNSLCRLSVNGTGKNGLHDTNQNLSHCTRNGPGLGPGPIAYKAIFAPFMVPCIIISMCLFPIPTVTISVRL